MQPGMHALARADAAIEQIHKATHIGIRQVSIKHKWALSLTFFFPLIP
jgi:hypothetical protein